MHIKEKVLKVATNPKVTKFVDKVTTGVAAFCAVASAAMINASAADVGMVISAETAVSNITDNASPFTEPAVIILCSVSGIKLGMRLIKAAAR